jgi:hypothetical protein
MRLRLLALAALPLALAVAVAAAGEAPRTDRKPALRPAADVDGLIAQLAGDDFAARERAADALRRLGPDSLPALKKHLNDPDAEVRRLLQEIIPALETAALLTPKTFDLKIDNRPIADVLAELRTQTGCQIDHFGNANPQQPFSFDLKDVTFWEALDRINRDAGLGLQPGYGDERIRLQAQDGPCPFVLYSGPFRLSATGLEQLRKVDLAVQPRSGGPVRRSESLTFSFTLWSEPRLPLLGVGDVKLIAAYDSEKNSMLPGPAPQDDGPNAQRPVRRVNHHNGVKSLSQQTSLELVRLSEKASSIRLIRGVLPVSLLVAQRPVVVTEKLLENKTKKLQAGQTALALEDVTEVPQNKQWQVRLTITQDGDEPGWSNQLYQRFELFDAKGNKYASNGAGWSGSANSVRMTLTFGSNGNAALGPPDKLVFQSWQTLQHPLEFEFRDIPLP